MLTLPNSKTNRVVNVYFDTEFTELSKNANLISIGMTTDYDDRDFYFVVENPQFPSKFVKENVFPFMYEIPGEPIYQVGELKSYTEVRAISNSKHCRTTGPYHIGAILCMDWLIDLLNDANASSVMFVSDVCQYDIILLNEWLYQPYTVTNPYAFNMQVYPEGAKRMKPRYSISAVERYVEMLKADDEPVIQKRKLSIQQFLRENTASAREYIVRMIPTVVCYDINNDILSYLSDQSEKGQVSIYDAFDMNREYLVNDLSDYIPMSNIIIGTDELKHNALYDASVIKALDFGLQNYFNSDKIEK